VQRATEAQCVLIGEASHGTHEFYATRAELTRRLIEKRGFQAVALEADWPDSFRVHGYVTGRENFAGAREALRDFKRFLTWMWRNTVVVEFVEWLREWNAHRPVEDRAGFFGLDLYSLHISIESVLSYLDKVDPTAARRARDRYACLEHFSVEPQLYSHATVLRGKEPCEDEVVAQLVEMRRRYTELISCDGHVAEEDFFSAEQNARLVMNAERYYRAMFHRRDESWNLRDTHMFETLRKVFSHFDGGAARVARRGLRRVAQGSPGQLGSGYRPRDFRRRTHNRGGRFRRSSVRAGHAVGRLRLRPARSLHRPMR
jgi:erythromycin esterase-like protein